MKANFSMAAAENGLTAVMVRADDKRDAQEAIKVAKGVAALGAPSVLAAKECVNKAFETTLAEGIHFERRLFFGLFSTEDQKEGMRAFVDKRPAEFKNR